MPEELSQTEKYVLELINISKEVNDLSIADSFDRLELEILSKRKVQIVCKLKPTSMSNAINSLIRK
jgi:hypothetical protein